jgi:hypothetical protein
MFTGSQLRLFNHSRSVANSAMAATTRVNPAAHLAELDIPNQTPHSRALFPESTFRVGRVAEPILTQVHR